MTTIDPHRLSHLDRLEAESIHILREVASEFRNPVMLYSVGKDSSVLLQVGGDRRGVVGGRVHQKYPSCFFFSIEADGSWSITRPWRSDVVATSISAMIASSVSASDSIAPVSG